MALPIEILTLNSPTYKITKPKIRKLFLSYGINHVLNCIVFCILHLTAHETINIPQILAGVHDFKGKTVMFNSKCVSNGHYDKMLGWQRATTEKLSL